MAAALAALLATAFVALAITGTARMYTPVPFWDMWGATLGFYIAITDGASWLWWAQHNEHRIVLSRLLFWLDYEFFGGLHVFLLVMNHVFVALAVLLFWRMSHARLRDTKTERATLYFFTCFLIAWLYQWMQHENLAWAFQSQFFLAQLLPLCAFYWLHKSASHERAHTAFAVACLFGVASAGTMANGILALPLMALYALITRMQIWRLLILCGLGVITLGLYFNNYASPPHHGSTIDTLLQQPLQVVQFVLLYLGTPFFNLFGRGTTGSVIAMASTVAMAAIAITFLYRGIKTPKHNTLTLALVFGVVYLAGTALGTATGRVTFGVLQAISYRYTTPALMAWACVLVLLLPWLCRQAQQFPRPAIATLLAVLALMLTLQWQAATPQHQLVFDRQVAGLALTLGVEDETQIQHVFELTPGLLRTVEVAEARQLGMFALHPWRDLRDTLGEIITGDALPLCRGHIDLATTLVPDQAHLAIQGWLYNAHQQQVPALITITDAAGIVSGFALTGQPRPDVADAVDDNAYLSGFRGYVSRELAGGTVVLIADSPACKLAFELPTHRQNP
ncbi:MAG: hypothetical protein CMQ34_05345 [Gammaproteobacteria bacterium]|nr:hypothetical protein [Gammaproteobacteria bacterium]